MDERIERLAELAVALGANVQRDQIVYLHAEPGHAEFARAITAEAYRHGARFVDVDYFDPYVKRARLEHADESTLEFVPSWYGERMLALGEQRCARIYLAGPTVPGVLDGIDPARSGRDMLPRLKESGKVVGERTTNWTIVPCPTTAWAQQVHPDLDQEAALERLWDEIVHVCRLDEPDPVAAWRERLAATGAAASRLTDRGLDALHFDGPGTDLTVGLLRTSRWANAAFATADGISHTPNIPSEEVFTTPDPLRTEGVVRATKPLVFSDGSVVQGLSVRFEDGRAVQIDAEQGAATLRVRCEKDAGATRLGEVALVDGEGRIGSLGTLFHNTLLDENAASHLALGHGFVFCVDGEDEERVNDSATHIDFMIGGDDVSVTGTTRTGERVPVLSGGAWQI